MNKKIKAFTCTILAISVSAGVWLGSYGDAYAANNLNELRERQAELNQEVEALEAERRIIRAEMSDVNQQIELTEEAIREQREILDLLNSRLDMTREALEDTQIELDAAAELREEQQARLISRARAMHINGPARYIDILLGAGSFSELLVRIEYVNRIIDHDQNIISDLRDTEEFINARLDIVHTQEQNLLALEMQHESVRDAYEELLEERAYHLAQLQADDRELATMISGFEQASREAENLIRAAENAQRAIATRPSNNRIVVDLDNLEGEFLWPVPGHARISSPYGNRTWANGRTEFHTGIDISAPSGVEVIASRGGTIIFSGWMNGYGNTVIIDHGDGTTSLYAHHSRLLVSQGESVQQGQLIALIGSTGFSTGPHLHFEVRVNGSHNNPMNFLN